MFIFLPIFFCLVWFILLYRRHLNMSLIGPDNLLIKFLFYFRIEHFKVVKTLWRNTKKFDIFSCIKSRYLFLLIIPSQWFIMSDTSRVSQPNEKKKEIKNLWWHSRGLSICLENMNTYVIAWWLFHDVINVKWDEVPYF